MRSLRAISALALCLGIAPAGTGQDKSDADGGETLLGIITKLDISCILRTWRIKGILTCVRDGVPRACLWVENAYPCGIIEVVRKPGRTNLLEVKPALVGIEALRLFGTTSSHTSDSGSGTALQFAEARVYSFVPPLPIDFLPVPIVKPAGPLFEIDYVSELDGFGWRTGLSDIFSDPAILLQSALPSCSAIPEVHRCAGNWGAWNPRIGFVSHPSEVMASHLTGLRAGRVAYQPLGRVVVSHYPFEPRTGHHVQMIEPSLRSCVSIGTPFTRAIETGALSLLGSYLFVHFGIFEDCKGCIPPRLVGPRPPIGS